MEFGHLGNPPCVSNTWKVKSLQSTRRWTCLLHHYVQRLRATCLSQLVLGAHSSHCTCMVIHRFDGLPMFVSRCYECLGVMHLHPFKSNGFRLRCTLSSEVAALLEEKDTLASHHAPTVDADISLHVLRPPYMW